MVNGMARYIDADALCKKIREVYDGYMLDEGGCRPIDFEDMVCEQPTAFDIEKVVDGLKDKAKWIEYETEDGLVMKQRVIPLAEAVNEVRKDGE